MDTGEHQAAAGSATQAQVSKSATAARIYDYFLGGVHNFPADQEAARHVLAMLPDIPRVARTNRAFLRRCVRYLVRAGVHQFLDIGSGIPTEGNVHEIAESLTTEARVVYVDIDPVAVAESLEILDDNPRVTAVRGDLRQPEAIIDHPTVRRLLDLRQPVALLLGSVLPFVPDDAEAYGAVSHLVAALGPGSHLAISHGATETFVPTGQRMTKASEVYRQRTTTPAKPRTREQVARFFDGLDLVEPGIAWAPEWRPDPDDPSDFADDPARSGSWVGVGHKR